MTEQEYNRIIELMDDVAHQWRDLWRNRIEIYSAVESFAENLKEVLKANLKP